jgi:hypothetical protein
MMENKRVVPSLVKIDALAAQFGYSQRDSTSRGELFQTLAGDCLEEAKNRWRNSIESRLILLG